MSNPRTPCLIIDDDPFIRDLLMDKLDQYLPELEVLATAESGTRGLELIKKHKPGLIFLDVEMADMTGFEMLSQIPDINFETIFITSYSHYAIQAIRFSALDYLVKPIDLGELKNAVKRYYDTKEKSQSKERVEDVLNNLKTKEPSEQILRLQTQDGEVRVLIKNIIRLEGERNYSYIHIVGGKRILCSKPLGELEEMLDGSVFYRCHKSHVINKLHIQGNPGKITINMSDGTEIPIARRKKEIFYEWYSSN